MEAVTGETNNVNEVVSSEASSLKEEIIEVDTDEEIRMSDVMSKEIKRTNEMLMAEVSPEANNVSNIMIEEVSVEVTSVNEVENSVEDEESDDNELDDDELDDNKLDDDESEDNKLDDNESDINESDDDESYDKKLFDKESDDDESDENEDDMDEDEWADDEWDEIITIRETPSAKAKHFFVVDLMKTVEIIKSKSREALYRIKFPEETENRCDLHFKMAYRESVLKYIRSQKENFISLITESVETSGSGVFDACIERFTKVYKPEEYSEVGFINFCGAVAYLGFYCLDEKFDLEAKDKAFQCIYDLLCQVLARSTNLSNSSW